MKKTWKSKEEEIMGIKEWEATVVSNYNVNYIKEFIVEIPEDMDSKQVDTFKLKFQKEKLNFRYGY